MAPKITPQRIARAIYGAATARATARDFGRRVAEVRELRELSMPQIERLTGRAIERSALSRIEAGSRPNLSLTTVLLLAVALDCDFLVRRDGTIEIRGTNLQRLAQRAEKGPA